MDDRNIIHIQSELNVDKKRERMITLMLLFLNIKSSKGSVTHNKDVRTIHH